MRAGSVALYVVFRAGNAIALGCVATRVDLCWLKARRRCVALAPMLALRFWRAGLAPPRRSTRSSVLSIRSGH